MSAGMGRTSWTPGVPGRGDATGGGELVWVAFGDQYRMFDNPGRLSGVLCRKCPEGADAVICTADESISDSRYFASAGLYSASYAVRCSSEPMVAMLRYSDIGLPLDVAASAARESHRTIT